MIIQLETGSAFLDPRWLGKVSSGFFESEVTDSFQVRLEGGLLNLPRDEKRLLPGTKVRVWMERFFVCEPIDEYEARMRKAQEQERIEAENHKTFLNQLKVEATEFNESLNIPFKWQTGFKDVLSGLSEHSFGDGRNKATVGHIKLLEDYREGRLSRKKGEFLCTMNTGKQWSGDSHLQAVDVGGEMYNPKVTCKACLKSAQRWAKTKQVLSVR